MKSRVKEMKKIYSYLLLSLLVLSVFVFSIQVISAQDSGSGATAEKKGFVDTLVDRINDLIKGVEKVGDPLFNALLGDTSLDAGEGEATFSKILIFFLVVVIIIAVLDFAPATIFAGPDRFWVRLIVGVIVAVLGVRFLPNTLITQLILPSSALVATITLGIPFIIFAIAIYNLGTATSGKYYRRAAWAVFGVILLVLWFKNSDKAWSGIYLWFLIACAVAFAFDGTLQKFMNRAKTSRRFEKLAQSSRGDLLSEIRSKQQQLKIATNAADIARIRGEIDILKQALNAL